MGFFGGLARGVAPFIIQRRKEKLEKELEAHAAEVGFYSKIAQDPTLKPNERALVLKNLGDLMQVDPTSKKGKKGQENILHQLSGVVSGAQSEETPAKQMVSETPGKAAEIFKSGFQKPGERRRTAIPDVPKRKSAFYSSQEMAGQEAGAAGAKAKAVAEAQLPSKATLEQMKEDAQIQARMTVMEQKHQYDRDLENLRTRNREEATKQRQGEEGVIRSRAKVAERTASLIGTKSTIETSYGPVGHTIESEEAELLAKRQLNNLFEFSERLKAKDIQYKEEQMIKMKHDMGIADARLQLTAQGQARTAAANRLDFYKSEMGRLEIQLRQDEGFVDANVDKPEKKAEVDVVRSRLKDLYNQYWDLANKAHKELDDLNIPKVAPTPTPSASTPVPKRPPDKSLKAAHQVGDKLMVQGTQKTVTKVYPDGTFDAN